MAKQDIVTRLLGEVTVGSGTVTPLREEAAAEITRLRKALCAADWALMKSIGSFPPPHGTFHNKRLHAACSLVRKETGNSYQIRTQTAERAIALYMTGGEEEDLLG